MSGTEREGYRPWRPRAIKLEWCGDDGDDFDGFVKDYLFIITDDHADRMGLSLEEAEDLMKQLQAFLETKSDEKT